MILIGVDIGGTKIAGAVVRVADAASVLVRQTSPTPRTGPDAVLGCAVQMVATLRAAASADVLAIGIGAPGIIDTRTGRVTAASQILAGWAGTAVREPIQDATGLPVFVDNDVRAMARAEARFGAGRDLDRCLYVSLGTGVGGAIGVRETSGRHRILQGTRGTAGEIAHLVTPVPGAVACGCGQYQHLEAIVSGPAISAEYARRTGLHADLPEIACCLADGDDIACAVVTGAGAIAGSVLAGVVCAFDLDGVVLAGGALNVGVPLSESIAESLRANIWPRGCDVAIRCAAMGGDAPVIGAALVAHDALQAKSS